MVEVNQFLLLGLMQALLVVSVLLAVWIWWLRRTRRQLRHTRTQLEHLKGQTSAVEYLSAELDGAKQVEPEEHAPWAAVRAALLEFELQRAEAGEAEAVDYEALRARLESLLPPGEPAQKEEVQPDPEANEESIDFLEMLRRQDQLLQALKTQVHGSITNTADLQRYDEKFNMLDLVGRELESCTQMMEEENNFLREQIRALLVPPESDTPDTEKPSP